jgi:nucleoside-diphosphate-sugar epimerase
MKKVLLTGASGFIGRHCIEPMLARDFEVHAVSLTPPPVALSTLPGVHWHRSDLLDAGAVKALVSEVEPKHLLHLAWYAVPGNYRTSPENLRWVQASLELYLAFAAHGGRRAVGAGSCIEYGQTDQQRCAEGVTPLAPSTLYGACKHAFHLMSEAFALEAGLSAAWGRIFFLYGPHEHPDRLVAHVTRSVLGGKLVRTTHGNQLRDFLHVGDIGAALAALLDSDVSGAVNIGSGLPVTLKDLFGKIAEFTGQGDLIAVGALPTPVNEPPVICADVTRLREEVGWSPQYDLHRGLRETVAWWKLRCETNNEGEARSA